MDQKYNGYLFIWDCDDTLLRKPIDDKSKTILTKPGIEALLQKGQENVVVSSGTHDATSDNLQKTGLHSLIKWIWGRDDMAIDFRDGKNYRRVIELMDYQDNYLDKAVVFGNAFGDTPKDVDDLVFIQDIYGFMENARVFEEVIDRLLTAGNGSFYNGFKALFSEGKELDGGYRRIDFKGYYVLLETEVRNPAFSSSSVRNNVVHILYDQA